MIKRFLVHIPLGADFIPFSFLSAVSPLTGLQRRCNTTYYSIGRYAQLCSLGPTKLNGPKIRHFALVKLKPVLGFFEKLCLIKKGKILKKIFYNFFSQLHAWKVQRIVLQPGQFHQDSQSFCHDYLKMSSQRIHLVTRLRKSCHTCGA